jgi:hypothetical protein
LRILAGQSDLIDLRGHNQIAGDLDDDGGVDGLFAFAGSKHHQGQQRRCQAKSE